MTRKGMMLKVSGTTLKVNNKLWIVSDTHFGHKNIIQYQQRPETHESIMLSEWIWRVQEDDQILHLGDVWMGKGGANKRWAAILSRMPGQKFLMLGNHDKDTADTYTDLAGFTIVKPFLCRGYAFTHCPISPLLIEERPKYVPQAVLNGAPWHTNIHGHTHGNPHHPEDGEPFEDKKYINMCVEITEFKPIQLGQVWKQGTKYDLE